MKPSPEAWLAAIEARARQVRVPLEGGGATVWRVWGEGPAIVFLHGGYGSWRHWARNIEPFAGDFAVLIPDMPGFGDSDEAPEPTTVDMLAGIVAAGAAEILGPDARYSLVGFSFGSAIGGHVTRWSDALDRLVLVGVNRLGIWPLKRPAMVNWRKAETPEALAAAHRHNLSAMMIHEPSRIDDLAIYLQSESTSRARVRSLDIVQTHALPECLAATDVPTTAIWGEHDVTLITGPDDAKKALAAIAPRARAVVIEGAGHWVQFEAADAFNAALRGALDTAGG